MANVQFSFKRYEKKYMLTSSQRSRLLEIINDKVVKDRYGEYTICSIYYDTDDFALIRKSIEKPVYKEKLRVRSYGTASSDSNVFIEIKKKFDGVVYKRRITASALSVDGIMSGEVLAYPGGQIAKEIEYFNSIYDLSPKVFIAYDRTAYAGKENGEVRITFDKNIRFRTYDLDLRKGDRGTKLLDSDLYLTEIKVPGACPLWLSSALTQVGAKNVSFSKYGECYKKYILPEIFKKSKKLPKGELLGA